MGLMLRLALFGGFVWVGLRLWPAIRSEPSTWFGEDWRQRLSI